MHLATADERAGNVWKEPGSNLVKLPARWFTPAVAEPDSFAFLTSRRISDVPDERRSEFGVHAHGPHAPELAGQLTRYIQDWDARRRHQSGPGFTLYPAGVTVAAPIDGKIFPRRHVQIALAWP